MIRESKYRKKYAEPDTPVEREILTTHYPIIHAFLALALAHHTGVHNETPGWAVEKIMSALYAENKDYIAMKKEYKEIARAIAYQAKKHGLTTDEEKTRKVMEQALLKTFKIVDKLLPEVTEERLKVVGRALHKDTDDPFVVLRNAGIDIEPELEEFRQFLAEISGKKIELKNYLEVRKPNIRIPSEVLAIIKGLEFADFSENAMQKAEKELLKLIDGLLDNEENALQAFYAVKLLRLIQRKDLDGIKKFKD